MEVNGCFGTYKSLMNEMETLSSLGSVPECVAASFLDTIETIFSLRLLST